MDSKLLNNLCDKFEIVMSKVWNESITIPKYGFVTIYQRLKMLCKSDKINFSKRFYEEFLLFQIMQAKYRVMYYIRFKRKLPNIYQILPTTITDKESKY